MCSAFFFILKNSWTLIFQGNEKVKFLNIFLQKGKYNILKNNLIKLSILNI